MNSISAIKPCCPSCGQTLPGTQIVVDLNTNHVIYGDKKVRLPPRLAEVLLVLKEAAPKFVTAEYIEACVMGIAEDAMSEKWCGHQIAKLNKALDPLPLRVENQWGGKYRLVTYAESYPQVAQ